MYPSVASVGAAMEIDYPTTEKPAKSRYLNTATLHWKKTWTEEIYNPIYEQMKIDIRMNLKMREVEIQTRHYTADISGGKTKFAIENAMNTRIAFAESKIHILGWLLFQI